jgi:hypothetical protein
VEFAAALYKRGGFKAINDALANPPRSTEQIMHPEKFMAAHKDEPIAVGLPPLTGTLASGWEYRESSTIGEFELQALLQGKNVASAESGAAGWGGGQYDLYTNGTNSLVFMGTIWDTLTDAQQFESGLRQSLVRTPNFQNLWTDGARYYTLKRVKNRVFYIGGTDRTAVKSALQVVK